jgi:hypothetical protein
MKRFIKLFLAFSLINSSMVHGGTYDNTPSGSTQGQTQAQDDGFAPTSLEVQQVLANPKTPPDRFHLVSQDLIYNGMVYSLFTLGESPIDQQTLDTEYFIDGDDFVVLGKSHGSEVARHIFRNIKIHSYVFDNEYLLAATTDGEIQAIDMSVLKKQAFKGPVPVLKNLIKSSQFIEPMAMTFWTRGASPQLAKNLEDSVETIFPHDRSGKLVLTAGDLILHRGPENRSKTFSALSRSVLLKNIEQLAERLAIETFVTSPDAFQDFPTELIGKLAEQENQTIEIDQVSQLALRSIPSDVVTKMLSQISGIQKDFPKNDQSNIDEWKASYSLMTKTAHQRSIVIPANGDLSDEWQDLFSLAMKKSTEQMEKPGFFKRHALVLATLSGVVGGLAMTYVGDHQSILSLIDGLYEKHIPPILKVAEYRFPLLASVTSLLSIIGLVQLAAWTHPHIVESLATSVKAFSSKMASDLRNMASTWRKMNAWQRLVTAGARVYSIIGVTFWNHLGSLLRQPQLFRTLKMGLNPFALVKKNSDLGESLDLQKNMRLGVNSPLLSSSKLKELQFEQQQALQYLTQDKLRARHLAFQLVALVLYQNQEIDPASLAMLLKGGTNSIDPGVFNELTPERKNEWVALSDTIANDWYQMGQSEGKLFDSIPAEEFTALLLAAKDKIAKFKESPQRQKRLLLFKHQANHFFKKLRQNLLLLGVSDGKILQTAYANKSDAEQVQKTFVSDHIIVSGLPAFWGDRANPEVPYKIGGNADGSDRLLLTFRPEDGSIANLWTSPEHMMDIWINVTTHFFEGGAKQILVYYSDEDARETKYRAAENVINTQKAEIEGAVKGSFNWVTNALDTRKTELGNFYVKNRIRMLRTIQANLILSLTFRFISTDPLFVDALAGWYLFFVAKTWTYAWPWVIIGQGNKYEERRFSEATSVLSERQLELSRSLRMGTHSDIARSGNALLDLYRTDEKRLSQLQQSLGFSNLEIDNSHLQIDARKLISYSFEVPPFPTEKNALPSWLSTWAGAISTTALAIPLGILSLDTHYMTPWNLSMETLAAAGGYGVAYMVLSKNGLWSKTLNAMESVVNRFKTKSTKEKELKRDTQIRGEIEPKARACKEVIGKGQKK